MSRPNVLETPMERRLNQAIDRRIGTENDFVKEIVRQINAIIASLDQYDPANTRSAIDLTQDQLREIVFKLNDVTNINTEKAAGIANIVKDSHLLRTPQSPQPQPPPSDLPTPPVSLTTQSPPSALPPQVAQRPTTPLTSIVNPGGTPSNGQNMGLKPGRRGGRRTRRKGKSKRIV